MIGPPMVGDATGAIVGAPVGAAVGAVVGAPVGAAVGTGGVLVHASTAREAARTSSDLDVIGGCLSHRPQTAPGERAIECPPDVRRHPGRGRRDATLAAERSPPAQAFLAAVSRWQHAGSDGRQTDG